MKTLADFKRAMKLNSMWYRKHVNEDQFVLRRVCRVCSDHVYVKEIHGTKEIRLDFPKSSEFNINESGEVEIFWPATYTYEGVERVEIPRRLVLTYKYFGEWNEL